MSEDAGFDVCVLHLLVCVCVFSAHWVTVSVFDNVCVCVSNQLCEENTPTSLSYLAPRSPPIGRCAVVRAAPPLAGKARRRQFVAVAKILLLGSRLLLGDVWCIMDGWISRGGANLKCWWLDSRSSVRLCRSLSCFLALYCHRSLSLCPSLRRSLLFYHQFKFALMAKAGCTRCHIQLGLILQGEVGFLNICHVSL